MRKIQIIALSTSLLMSGAVFAGMGFHHKGAKNPTGEVAAPKVTTKKVEVGMVSPEEPKVNINQANANELAAVKGLGPKKAAAVVAYRDQHGAFGSVADLDNVKGIGQGVLNRVQDKLTV